MATARRTATNENISTYGDGTRNYTSLATWEAATDLDMVATATSYVLECYDDAASFDDSVDLAGAAGDTDADYFRIIRPAGTKGVDWEGHDGTPNTGFTIDNTTAVNTFVITENYSQFQDLIIKASLNSADSYRTIRLDSANAKGIGIITTGINNGAGTQHGGIAVNDGAGFVDCLFYELEGNGCSVFSAGGNESHFMYNCTIVDCGAVGFTFITVAGTTGTQTTRNVLSTGNSGGDFSRTGADGTIDQDYCCSSDGTADTWGVNNNLVDKTITYRDAANDDYHTSDSDVVGNGVDLSADSTFAFDDDIDFETRVAWDIGFDEYIAPPGGKAQLIFISGEME